MRRNRIQRFAVIALATLTTSAYASHIHRGPTAGRHKVSAHVARASRQAGTEHARGIDDTRAVAIQTSLVKAGYLSSVSGHWDAESKAAMEKMQADNGWQTQIVPDSRALIKLGLGPNSTTATSAVPVATSNASAAQVPLAEAASSIGTRQ